MDNLDAAIAKLRAAADAAQQAAQCRAGLRRPARRRRPCRHRRRDRPVRLSPGDFRPRRLRRLLCRLVGDAGAAYAADVGDQRDLVGHRRRRAAFGRRRRGRQRLGLRPLRRLHRADPRLGEHLRRLPRHRAHARDVQEEGLTADERQSRRPALSRLGHLFILALRGLSSPATSRQGNRFGMIGMAIAVADHAGVAPARRASSPGCSSSSASPSAAASAPGARVPSR